VRAWLQRLRRARRKQWPGDKLWLQVVRRSVQVAVLLLMVAIPVLSLYDNMRAQRDDQGIQARAGTRLVHSLVGDMEEPEKLTQFVRGSVWTLRAGDTTVSDPLAVLDFMTASRRTFDPFLLTALIPLLLTVLLGRVFCGWICPADLLFEVGGKVRKWAHIEQDVPFARALKFVILAVGGAAGFWLGAQVFAEIYPPRLLSGELYLWITIGALGAGAWFLLLVLAFEIFVSRRFWCRYVCPGGALYSLLGRWRVVRLKVASAHCTSCEKCLPVCEFGLDPMRGRVGAECNNCGQCVRSCARGALSWKIGLRPKSGLDVVE